MLFANVVLLGTAALAAASRPFNFKREDLAFPIDTIPAVCDEPCKIYKDVFTTCPDNGGAEVCTSVCNGTTLTLLQVCINCTLIEGPPKGMTQFNIDVLNTAQQQLAQSCVEAQYPAQYSGKVPNPNTVAYPSGVDKATFVSNSTAVPTASATKNANSSATTAAPSGVTNTPATASGDLQNAASALSFSLAGVLVVAAGAALV